MTERLGIFGGSFSPPHAGHLYAADVFLHQMQLDKLLIIPAHISPGKQEQKGISPEDRLAMCRLAFAGLPHTEVSDIEIRRGGQSYTVDTLQALAKPGRKLFVLCGTDTALSLDRWHLPGVLFEMAEFVCIRRLDDPTFLQRFEACNKQYAARFGHTVTLLQAPAHPVSSTAVRAALAAGEAPSELAPEVLAYIKQNGLYRS